MIKFLKKIYALVEKIVQSTKINVNWLIFIFLSKKIQIMTKEETINFIINHKISIARYGDGEFRLMLQDGEIGFQKKNYLLSQKLIESYSCRSEKLLVCTYDFLEKLPKKTKQFYWTRWAITRYHNRIKRYYDYKYRYGNASITRFYHPNLHAYTNFDYIETTYIPLLKKIWNNRNIIIVEGKDTKLGCGNSLFENANTIRRIICPSINAFDRYLEIYKNVLEAYVNDDLIIIALGPTASVLSSELTIRENIQCIDIGHVDVVYFWFLNKSKECDKISGKFVNESNSLSNTIYVKYDIKKYESQIIKEIL